MAHPMKQVTGENARYILFEQDLALNIGCLIHAK